MSDWRMVREDHVGGLHVSDPFESDDQEKAEAHFKPTMDYWRSHGEKVWLTKDNGPVYPAKEKRNWKGWTLPGAIGLAFGIYAIEALTGAIPQTPPIQPPWWVWIVIPTIIGAPFAGFLILLAIPTDECEVCHKRIWRRKVNIQSEEPKDFRAGDFYPVHTFHRSCFAYCARKEIPA